MVKILEKQEYNISYIEDYNTTFMVGCWNREKEMYTTNGDYVEYINFFVTPLAEEPKIIDDYNRNLENKNDFIASDHENLLKELNIEKHDYKSMSNRGKQRLLEEKLRNKIIIFNPALKVKDKLHKNLKIIEIIEVNLEETELKDFYLHIVPELKITEEDFKKKIKEKNYINFKESSPCIYWPQYIKCQNKIFELNCTWKESINGNIRNKKIEKWDGMTSYLVKDESDILELKSGLLLIDPEEIEKMEDIKEEIQEKIQNIEEIKILNVTRDINENTEYTFLKEFSNYVRTEGFSYSFKDLVNFHLCVKTNVLTILAGMTGTGKSKLARLYSEMLDLTESNKTLLFLPVSPNFHEPSDLIGYINPMTGLYIPDENGFIDILVEASKNRNQMYMIVFDEMNLSQVEHWFAPFISILEEKEENRFLNLYSSKAKCLNDFLYPPKIKIGSNIRFVGTMNMDETTKDISDRLLDRSNVISLAKKSFKDLKKMLNNSEELDYKIGKYTEDYNSWISSINAYELLTEEKLEFFDKLHEIIVNYDLQKGVSFRVIEKIGEYLNNIPIGDDDEMVIEINEAIDFQLAQRVISKIKGSKKQFGELLGEYNFQKKEIEESILIEFFNRNRNISEFERVKKIIEKKSKELSIYGYTN